MKDYQLRDTRERVAAMREAGMIVAEIAKALDISTQRVYQHMEALGLPRGRKTPENGSQPVSEVSE